MSVLKPTIVFLSTYPPRECGIATFTQDLFHASRKILGPQFRCKIAAFNLSPLDRYKYPHEVKWEIDQSNKKEYINLAKEINSDPSVSGVILQHEYGIFGGTDGENILYFMEKCNKPILVTLHTALPRPSIKMKEVTTQIIDLASTIVVLTRNSKEVIESEYPNSSGKTFIIPHGIHDVPFSSQEEFKTKLELGKHLILSTFGLLSRGKGIEYAISALPDVIKKYPSVIYLILGETHPVIRRNEGEKYRLELAKLITMLGLEKYVRFYDQYLDLPDLLQFLQATDIYVSTSINPNQAVSGTLSYALGTGRPVVSTEFAQSKEIVSIDIGRLVQIKDSKALSRALLDLLQDKSRLRVMSKIAYDKTRPMLWKNVSEKYTNLLLRTIVPPINLIHLKKMTDNTGLFQFALLTEPNKDFGYALDDNARALAVCCWLYKKNKSRYVLNFITTYLSFVKRCQQVDDSFVNYIRFPDLIPTEQNSKEDLSDTQSRALCALSEVMSTNELPIIIKTMAGEMFTRYLSKWTLKPHLRSNALAIKALEKARASMPKIRTVIQKHISACADFLVAALRVHSSKSWCWFENDLNYNNALLPEALFIAGMTLGNPDYVTKAEQSLDFLISKTFTSDMYMPIGHAKWYKNKEKRSQFDQQPEDPASVVSALTCAYRVTKKEKYRNLAKKCFSWFLGNNSLNKSLYDAKTGGCYDGLHPDRVNLNQGAESLVSYLMSRYLISELN